MRRKRGNGRADKGFTPLFISVCSVVLLLTAVFGGIAEASWSHVEGRSEMMAARSSPVSTIIKQAVGQSVSLLMLAVAIIIAVPLVIAGFAFSVSYVLSRIGRRWERPRAPHHKKLPVGALPRAS